MTLKGTAQPQRQADEREWVAGQGWVTIEVWDGTKAAIEGLALVLSNTPGYSRIRVFSQDNVVWRLHATIGGFDGGTGDDEIVNTWEVIGQAIEEKLIHLKKAQDLGDSVLEDIKAKVDDPSSDVTIPTGDATTLYNLLLRGQDKYQRGYYVLRNTRTANTYAELNASQSRVDQLWLTASLPHGDMPAEVSAFINNIVADTLPSGYAWAWLKQTPELTRSINARAQLTQEWWLYGWSTFIYGNAA